MLYKISKEDNLRLIEGGGFLYGAEHGLLYAF